LLVLLMASTLAPCALCLVPCALCRAAGAAVIIHQVIEKITWWRRAHRDEVKIFLWNGVNYLSKVGGGNVGAVGVSTVRIMGRCCLSLTIGE
jgi:hypothetical protein